MTKKAIKSKKSFAENMAELEAIVAWFESADADISEGLAQFEKGAELAKILKTQLEDIENKVTKIQASFEE